MRLTDAEAADITTECIEAIEWQIAFILNPDKDSVEPSTFINAIKPKQPATLRLIEQLSPRDHPMKVIVESATGSTMGIVLLATTVNSIARILTDQGFGGEARQIEDALRRSDSAAQLH